MMCSVFFEKYHTEEHVLFMDFHTHNLNAAPGSAIINLPECALLQPGQFDLVAGSLYSVGIHPWWTEDDLFSLFLGLEFWVNHSQIVALGECGLDKLRGASMSVQEFWFERQVLMAEDLHLPVTVHCVKAFDRLLSIHKRLRPCMQWTVHGFRGKPDLAKQLLSAGMNLSFGKHFNAESFALTPPERRYRETDEDYALVE